MEQILRAIEAVKAEKGRCLVAIDGRCASGKTTLAAELGQRYGCDVIHMDQFFLRPEQRTPERYAQPGGNVDRERFLAEVLLPLERGEPVAYRPFNCGTLTLDPPVTVPPAPVQLIEGSYACHPDLRDRYDLRIFLTVDSVEQLRRIEKRNGPAALAAFREKWIPLEEWYFSACAVESCCHIRGSL